MAINENTLCLVIKDQNCPNLNLKLACSYSLSISFHSCRSYELEDLAETEAILGAFAISSGISPEDANYGFLSKISVRTSTKEKIAMSTKSKKDLKTEVKKSLKKIGYSIKEKSIQKPISVDHEKKVVYFSSDESEKIPVLKTKNQSIYELESEIENDFIANMQNKESITFNYKHPLFDISRDRKIIKEIISIIYFLHSENKLTDNGLIYFNKILLEVFGEEKEE